MGLILKKIEKNDGGIIYKPIIINLEIEIPTIEMLHSLTNIPVIEDVTVFENPDLQSVGEEMEAMSEIVQEILRTLRDLRDVKDDVKNEEIKAESWLSELTQENFLKAYQGYYDRCQKKKSMYADTMIHPSVILDHVRFVKRVTSPQRAAYYLHYENHYQKDKTYPIVPLGTGWGSGFDWTMKQRPVYAFLREDHRFTVTGISDNWKLL